MGIIELQLIALRALCQSIVHSVDSYLAAVQQEREKLEAPAEPPALDASEGCPHPMPSRVPAPAMGAVKRYQCRLCGALVNPEGEV